MKRILFFSILLIQIAAIFILTFQFESVEQTGKEMMIKTIFPDEELYYDPMMYIDGTSYVEYDINRISEEKWNNSESIAYNKLVYVLLEKNEEGIFEVVTASDQPIENISDAQVVLTANYSYHDKRDKYHYVLYGFERIKQIEKYGSFRRDDELLVTVVIGKWGQRKIIDVEKYDGVLF